ncbi:uncharacterized protein LTR77_007711 [Saxophila tyrrhenica]|uniref:DUF1993 domain-containing protein n=1 Tax=Saxophila tyrrhenica TaxID=1690608 RepID=A0AAV9P2S7_9PEZI|nr:hypothetical protein LTR77_007711 [Saxophila tyrrhenica]
MTSLYKQSVRPLERGLTNLSGLLKAGAKFADEKGMSHEEMLSFRLAPDMRGLPYQVQSCSNTAKFFFTRIGAIDNVVFEDNETTFEQLQERITKTIELIRTVPEEAMAGKETEPVLMETGMGTFRFESAQSYWSDFALPNVHFHMSSAYCILRHLGAPIRAFDYIGKDVFVKV